MSGDKPWECPRCGRMNAPFNPACFCRKEENNVNIPGAGIAQLPYGYKKLGCSTCGGNHGTFAGHPVECVSLKQSTTSS